MMNKTMGSALIVAGVTIGAGMLAMPLTSAEMGFSYTVVLLFLLWGLLSFSALLFVEVYQKAPSLDAGISTLAEQYFGLLGRFVATTALVVFMYAIISAYISGGGSLMSVYFEVFGSYAMVAASIAFTLVLGLVVVLGTRSVDMLTRVLFVLKLIAFFLVLLMMLPKVKMSNLGAMPLNHLLIISASPVFFTSFGFHVVLPSINQYLEGDIRRLRRAILIGTGIPLMAYILWQFAIHGALSQSQFIQVLQNNPTLDGLVKATAMTSPLLGEMIRLFSTLALITSFLGVALSLFHCLDDLLKRVHITAGSFVLGMLTFLPALVFVLFFPKVFTLALGYAGQIFAFYGLILPIGLVWRLRKLHPNLPYRVAGGSVSLVIALVLGVIIMLSPVMMSAGLLPPVLMD